MDEERRRRVFFIYILIQLFTSEASVDVRCEISEQFYIDFTQVSDCDPERHAKYMVKPALIETGTSWNLPLANMSPSRSTKITVNNQTSVKFNLDGQAVDHGIWSLNLEPPQYINANSSVWFQCESAGVMTGDQGNVTYRAGDLGQFNLRFNNPFSGGNDYGETLPAGLKVDREGGGGNDASVVWTISAA
ncbi:hypothetical protein OPT61_g7119 [Boeremia exigua]|uniref:Uncharacterized protein n=1 Tax=Boeremia exigua TaxID=749465 RepID=A0ACC2I4H2_9PLEO|nr:hypothetical protein OPT61_g7119 [Boeremia exigua]